MIIYKIYEDVKITTGLVTDLDTYLTIHLVERNTYLYILGILYSQTVEGLLAITARNRVKKNDSLAILGYVASLALFLKLWLEPRHRYVIA